MQTKIMKQKTIPTTHVKENGNLYFSIVSGSIGDCMQNPFFKQPPVETILREECYM